MHANNSCMEPGPSEAAIRHREQWETHCHWKARVAAIEAACSAQVPGLFKGAINQLGQPIEAGTQDRILSYLNAPSLDAWLEIRALLIGPLTTLWQAWFQVDPSAPMSGRSGPCPAPETLIRAIRAAIEAERDHALANLHANPDPGPRLRLVK